MSNHLKKQNSPYLLQHADNPVDWYPWCDEAFETAKKEDKPVFLSIGYSTCHWCHVMAHESFENEKIADILNKYFISVKVDREERPDIDSVYMTFCQAFTGSGGWPMSIFMTPEQKPFFAGTYFPPESQYGRLGLRKLLLTVAERWQDNKIGLLETAEAITGNINAANNIYNDQINEKLPEMAAGIFSENFDKLYGGFGPAPKFPVPHNLIFLMLYSHIHQEPLAKKQAEITLDKMRRGGIFDHIGYGFSRYSTDSYFLVPHFEKMLYDNALLIIAYSIAYKASDNSDFLDTAEKTAIYITREMTGEHGEFYSAQDADSEGEEGRYYVWDYNEICDILGNDRGKMFCDYYGITKQGNFEGKNIPNLLNGNTVTDKFNTETDILYNYRKSRAHLHLDDKILTSWNSIMICGMSILYRVTGNSHYLNTAINAEKFISETLIKDNLLYSGCRNGILSVKGFLDDYAYYLAALLCLYEATCNNYYLNRAEDILKETIKQFEDKNAGGYYLYGTLNENLVSKPKETYDGAMPSGNSIMAYCLVRMSQLSDDTKLRSLAERQLAFMSSEALHYPAGYSMFLISLMFYLNPPQQITVVLSDTDKADEVIPHLPLYADIKILTQYSEEYGLLNNRTTYYVCKNQTCLPPTNSIPRR